MYVEKRIETAASAPIVLSGDIRDDKEHEIILVDGNRISVYTADGDLAEKKQYNDVQFHSCIRSDIDGDQKAELILGAKEDKNCRLLCINGFLDVVFDAAFTEMIKGNTTPVRCENGEILFYSHSSLYVSPKLIGTFNIAEKKPSLLYRLGPVPTGLSVSKDSDEQKKDYIAVSHRGVSGEWREITENFAVPKDRQGIITLGDNGGEAQFIPIGPKVKSGFLVEGGISGIDLAFFDINSDEEEEIITLINRVSELYTGRAQLQVRDREGTVLTEYNGPKKTEGSFGFYDDGLKKRIVLAWKQYGKVVLLDESLKELNSTGLPGGYHHTELRGIGDLNGDGAPNFLISDWDKLYITDENCKTLYRGKFPHRITDTTLFLGEDGKLRIGVIAGHLYILKAAENSVPPENAFTEAGLSAPWTPGASGPDLSPLPESGTVTTEPDYYNDPVIELSPVPATPPETYEAFARKEETAAPAGHLRIVSDFLGGPEKELFFFDRGRNLISIYSHTLQLISRFSLDREENGRIIMFADADRNGKTDIVSKRDKPYGIVARNGLGEVIFTKPVAYGFDTHFTLSYRSDRFWLFGVDTGYMLSPRGYYGYDPKGDEILFFRPTAASLVSFGGLVTPEGIFSSSRTVSNGAELVLPDGRTDRDTTLFLHVFDRQGNMLPGSGPTPFEDNSGNLKAFTITMEHGPEPDKKEEIYIQEGKYEGYYEGTSRIYRFNPDAAEEEKPFLELLHEGPKGGNGNPNSPRTFMENGRQRIALIYNKPAYVEYLDSSYKLLRRFVPVSPEDDKQTLHPGYLRFFDLDRDGTSEMFAAAQDGLFILDLDGNIVRKLSVPDSGEGAIVRYAAADLDNDGKTEIVVCTDKKVRLYGY